MSDGWVWLRCNGCGEPIRLLTFSGGEWGLWSGVDEFVRHHTQECFGDRRFDIDQSRNGFSFFEIVNEKDAEVWQRKDFSGVNELIRDPKKPN